ncbi:hypothetical protein GOP47_0011965 [Adiantum capillus-veneris]|uniref:Pentatricopeptide repeat-containing protein n=1 Tax=Adiantum capillus-veneris TaxID=13818 RepID=A0A9D4UU74_ADICA|nr:hypothetical protein GOP47_0011965 [Adiantum capillus-veneris]
MFSQSSSKSPNFKHKMTMEPLWIDGSYSSSWVHEEPRRRRMLISAAEAKHADLSVNMKENGMDMKATSLSFVVSLKACTKKKDLHQASKLHADIKSSGLLESNIYLGNMLASLYAKCGALAKAQEVLDWLPVRNVVSWNALISGYSQQGLGHESLECYELMRSEGLSPNAITYTCILKACGITQDVDMGKKIHDEIVNKGLLGVDRVLGNALVDMYAKCGAVAKAQLVLDELPAQDVVSWNALIAGYAQQMLGEEALNCYEQMQRKGISPNAITYTCILKACGITQNTDRGKHIHDEIVSKGLLGIDAVLGNALVDMYAKCGAVSRAQEVFDDLPVRNVVSWNALIAGYAQERLGEKALDCYEMMRNEGLFPNAITYTCSLRACGITQDIDSGKQIHDELVGKKLLGIDAALDNAVVDMYAKCGAVAKAHEVLDGLPIRNVDSCNALIEGYTEQGLGQKALDCYERMQSEGLSPNAITYTFILKACGITLDIDKGMQIHDHIVSKGHLGRDAALGNALVDMYAKWGAVAKAQVVLDGLPVQDVVSWNALIAGYAQQELGEEALNCYEQMRRKGITPNAITYTCILKVCGITHNVDRGKQIHDEIVTQGLLGRDEVLGNALVNMYAKCGVVARAQQVFDDLPVRDVVSWNALITGYSQQGLGKQALVCYEQMRSEGFSPDAITYSCILKACSITRNVDKGKQIYNEIVSEGLLGTDVGLVNALVDMYAKCGAFSRAQQVLDEMPVRDVVSWNALIAGYAQQEQGKEALDCLQRLRSECFNPNAITYTCILKACGITQDVDRGKQIHDEIVRQGLLEVDVVLGNALVDMYAKCGEIFEAHQVLDELPVRDVVSWSALIAGYAQQGHGKEALDCYERMQREGLSPNPITYTCILKAFSTIQDVDRGNRIGYEIVTKGLLERNVLLGNALIDMYAKCGAASKAQQVLYELPVRDVVSWSALIAGYVRQGLAKEGLDCYEQMESDGLSPDAITYTYILKACGITRDMDRGEKLHDEIISKGLLLKDELGNALVSMYAKCGAVVKAQQVLDKLPVRDIVSWTALIAGYAQQGQCKEAMDCFERMRSEGVTSNIVLWNALIGGYAQQGLAEEALNCFHWMQREGTSPDAVTFVCMLKSCSHLGLVNEGQMYFKQMRENYGTIQTESITPA